MNIKQLVSQHGKENVMVVLKLNPLFPNNHIVEPVLCEIDETRYKVDEGYKIGFIPVGDNKKNFPPQSFYQGDFNKLVEVGSINILVDKTLLDLPKTPI